MTLETNMSLNLQDYIKVYENFLTQDICKQTIKKLKKSNWQKHSYHNNNTNESSSYDNDLSVTNDYDFEESHYINNNIRNAIELYASEFNFRWWNSVKMYTPIRFNRYDEGTEMRIHCDHIHSIFDGNVKGIPTLTILGALNDDYEGGELTIFDSWILPLKAGSVTVFPSNFLFPHEVLPVKKGTRYSYVSWAS